MLETVPSTNSMVSISWWIISSPKSWEWCSYSPALFTMFSRMSKMFLVSISEWPSIYLNSSSLCLALCFLCFLPENRHKKIGFTKSIRGTQIPTMDSSRSSISVCSSQLLKSGKSLGVDGLPILRNMSIIVVITDGA